jgi:glyoxylase-like metal-dependent hydrolase (beta-lactamase superfamily II)
MSKSCYEVIKIDEHSWRIEDNVVRVFLFAGTQRALLVDTGFGTGNLRQIVESLTDKPVMLVNTHADDDHTGCNALFDEAYMHPSEMAFYFEKAPSGTPVRPLWEGDVIDLGSRRFEVILIPGHTPGSIALLDRENALLVSGDSVSATPVFMFQYP